LIHNGGVRVKKIIFRFSGNIRGADKQNLAYLFQGGGRRQTREGKNLQNKYLGFWGSWPCRVDHRLKTASRQPRGGHFWGQPDGKDKGPGKYKKGEKSYDLGDEKETESESTILC